MRDSTEDIVVAVEWEESGQLHPAVAELLVSVSVEATGIDAEHGDAEDGEVQSLRDREVLQDSQYEKMV